MDVLLFYYVSFSGGVCVEECGRRWWIDEEAKEKGGRLVFVVSVL